MSRGLGEGFELFSRRVLGSDLLSADRRLGFPVGPACPTDVELITLKLPHDLIMFSLQS